MTYEDFQRQINGWIKASGIKSKVFFDPGEEKKRYEARIPEHDLLLTAPHSGISITVKGANGFLCMARVAA
jgi:hypothetical protein